MSEKEKKVPVEEPERGIQPWYPHEIFQAFDDMLENFRSDFLAPRRPRGLLRKPWRVGPLERRVACADLIDNGKEFQVCAEIPGVPKDKIDITITKKDIEISAKAEVERAEEEKGYVVKERGYTEIYRRFSFPEEVIPEKAEATLKNGLLEVKVPKKTPTPEVKKHKVDVK